MAEQQILAEGRSFILRKIAQYNDYFSSYREVAEYSFELKIKTADLLDYLSNSDIEKITKQLTS